MVVAAPVALAQEADQRAVVPADTPAWAQAPAMPPTASPAQAATPVTDSEPRQAALSAGQVRFRTGALVLAAVGGTAAYGRAKWWQDGFSGGFKTVNEGWFGQGTDYGGADKLGHAMFAYTGTRLMTRAFEWAGNDTDRALKLGLWTAVGTLMGVELVDGFSQKWRFSNEDALANLAGGALGYLLETHPALDALVDLRIQYSPSTGPQGRRSFDPFGDYSGQRLHVVFKASGVSALKQNPLLRYLEFSVGYGTRNFEQESRALAAPTRHVYYGISLNLSELLRNTAYRGNTSPSRTQRLTETFFEFVQVPATSVQSDHVIR